MQSKVAQFKLITHKPPHDCRARRDYVARIPIAHPGHVVENSYSAASCVGASSASDTFGGDIGRL